MRLLSRTLIKINFTIFSCIFCGCALNPKAFENEYKEPARLADTMSDNRDVIKTFEGRLGKSLVGNHNNFYLISTEKKKNYLQKYNETSQKYFSGKKLSIPGNFREIIMKLADTLYNNGSNNLLFYLVTPFIDALHILENDEFFSVKEKPKKVQELEKIYHDVVDRIVYKALGISESTKAPNGNRIFDFEKILSSVCTDNKECFSISTKFSDVCFPVLVGPASQALEVCIIRKQNKSTKKDIKYVKEYFSALQDEAKNSDFNAGIYAILDGFDNYISSYINSLLESVNQKFDPFFSFEKDPVLFRLRQYSITFPEMVRSFENLESSLIFIPNLKEIFNVNKINGSVTLNHKQRLFRLQENREHASDIFPDEFTTEELKKKGQIIDATMIVDYKNHFLKIDKRGNEEKFLEADKMIQTIFGIGISFIFDFFKSSCNEQLSKTPNKIFDTYASFPINTKSLGRKQYVENMILTQFEKYNT